MNPKLTSSGVPSDFLNFVNKYSQYLSGECVNFSDFADVLFAMPNDYGDFFVDCVDYDCLGYLLRLGAFFCMAYLSFVTHEPI